MKKQITQNLYRFRLDEILKERDISIKKLAEKAGVNYRTAFDMARNNTRGATLETISKICAALEIQPGELFVK